MPLAIASCTAWLSGQVDICLNISPGVVKCVALNEHLTRRICGLAFQEKNEIR